MYERFTDRARKVMQLANQEAQRRNHEYIGTEHILLGLAKEGCGVATRALSNRGVDVRTIVRVVNSRMHAGPDRGVTIGKLPMTPRTKAVIEYSMEEARNLGHNYVGTDHILLGLLRETEGLAAQVLSNFELPIEIVREEIVLLLGREVSSSSLRDLAAETEAAAMTHSESPLEHTRIVFALIQAKQTGWLAWLSTPRLILKLLAVDRFMEWEEAVKTEPEEPVGPPEESSQVTAALREAKIFAKSQRRAWVTPCDILYGVSVVATKQTLAALRSSNVRSTRVGSAIASVEGIGSINDPEVMPTRTLKARRIVANMVVEAAAAGSAKIELIHLIEVLLDDSDDVLQQVLNIIGTNREELAAKIRHYASEGQLT